MEKKNQPFYGIFSHILSWGENTFLGVHVPCNIVMTWFGNYVKIGRHMSPRLGSSCVWVCIPYDFPSFLYL